MVNFFGVLMYFVVFEIISDNCDNCEFGINCNECFFYYVGLEDDDFIFDVIFFMDESEELFLLSEGDLFWFYESEDFEEFEEVNL